MTEQRGKLGSRVYALAWTAACNRMRRIDQPGTNWTYSFAENEAKTVFDQAWMTAGISAGACIDCAVNSVEVLAQNRFRNNEAARLKQAQQGQVNG